jgi:hypothetical protein
MSTNINITVGDSGLLDRARQQQAASRQTQLNREASVQLEAEATAALLTNANAIASGAAFNAARTAAFATQGRDASGNLIAAPSRIQPYIAPRPAANRRGGPLQWIFDYSNLQRYVRDVGVYYVGTYKNGSKIQPFEIYGAGELGSFGIIGDIDFPIESDEWGDYAYMQSTSNYKNLNALTIIPEREGLSFEPVKAFNKVLIERVCYIPIPNIPPPVDPEYPVYAARFDGIVLYIRDALTEELVLQVDMFFTRLSSNWSSDTYNVIGVGDRAYQSSLVITITGTDGGILTDEFPVNTTANNWRTATSYDGTTGVVSVSVNGTGIMSFSTDIIVEPSRYSFNLEYSSYFNGAISAGEANPSGPSNNEPGVKLYESVVSFR